MCHQVRNLHAFRCPRGLAVQWLGYRWVLSHRQRLDPIQIPSYLIRAIKVWYTRNLTTSRPPRYTQATVRDNETLNRYSVQDRRDFDHQTRVLQNRNHQTRMPLNIRSVHFLSAAETWRRQNHLDQRWCGQCYQKPDHQKYCEDYDGPIEGLCGRL